MAPVRIIVAAAMIDYPPVFRTLVARLKAMPGVGARGAERIALWALGSGRGDAADLARELDVALAQISACPVCGFFATSDGCGVCDTRCGSATRAICVVERAMDVLPIERTGAFTGSYHVLGGKLSPLDNIGPDDLRLPLLRQRVEQGVDEVILALGADVEGEATCHYLTDYLAGYGARITRLAQGLPAGGGLDHADPVTVLRAFAGRREM